MFFLFWILIFLCAVMGIGTRFVLEAFDRLVGGLTGRGKVVVASVLVALSTSLPELFVTFASVIENKPEIALGTLLGSNVADLSIIIGGAVLLAGSLPIVGDYWRFELAAAFLAGVAPILLMLDGRLSRIDGMILIVIYLIYLYDLVLGGRKKHLHKSTVSHGGIFTKIGKHRFSERGKPLVQLIAGILVLFVCGDWLVLIGSRMAGDWGVPIGVVGILVVSVGTSLPELFLSTGAILKKNVALVLGNILGSVITNATLIVGLLAFFRPFGIEKIEGYALVNMAFVVVFGLFWMFTSTKKKLERWEGLILLGIFLIFVGLTLLFPF